MRTLRCLAAALLLPVLLCLCVSAVSPEESLTEGVDPEQGLSEELQELLGDFSADGTTAFSESLGNIFSDTVAKSGSTIRQGLTTAAIILAAMLLCGIFGADSSSSRAGSIVGALVIAAACTGGLHSMIRLGSDTLEQMNHYSLLLLPSLTTLLAACGAAGTSAAVYVGAMLFLELLMTLIAKLLLPLVYLFTALSVAEAALDNEMLSKLREFIRWLVTICLKTVVYIFTGYLALSGVIAGSSDAARLKAAKLALSGTVPVVGGMISDASETVLSSAGIIKSAVGTYGMLAVIGICALPFLQIGIQYLLLKMTATIGGMIGRKNHVTLVENLSNAMGLLLAMTGAYCLMSLLSIALCIKAVGV